LILTLFSGALFLLPVGVTFSTYVGIESQKVMDVVHGKIPNGYNPDGTLRGPRVVKTDMYCQKSFGVIPYPGRYVYNPNQWGDPGNTGALCLSVTTDSGVPSDDLFAFNFTAVWGYPQGPESEPVHAFPNAQLNSSEIPIKVSDLKTLVVDVAWNYAAGSLVSQTTDQDALTNINLNANIAVDMFLDDDKTKAQNSSIASVEVMVWLGHFGDAVQPIGQANGAQDAASINGTDFNLYYGDNAQGQHVFTWIASQTTTSFVGDISPLITRLGNIGVGPTADSFLGYAAFGSEAFYVTTGNATLSVPNLAFIVNGK